MKLTKEEAKKLLETAEAILKEYETWTDPETGVTTDDEGNVVSRGWRGGRHSTNGYNRSYTNYSRRPTPAPLNPPGEDENAAATRIANAIAKKKGQAQADQGLINWVLKQRALGKLGGKAPAAPAAPPAAPPVAESMLENEVKSELLEVASKLLQEAQKKMKEADKKGKKFTQKGHDIAMNVKKSEKEAGKSDEEAERIAWATATKQGERIKGK